MNRLIIVGSPRVDGRCAHLANDIFEACIEDCPDDELALAPVSTLEIAGCCGCDGCKGLMASAGAIADGAGDAEEAEASSFPCVIEDDMAELYPLIDAADEATVVAPVYFSGASSQLKALLDRFQPYYWTDARSGRKRPAVLHVVGEGGDPHGFSALVSEVRSALGVAGFRLETVYDWVGKIDESGEILADAEMLDLTKLDGSVQSLAGEVAGEPLAKPSPEQAAPKQRAKLTLSDAPKQASGKSGSKAGGKTSSKAGNKPGGQGRSKNGTGKSRGNQGGGKRRG